MFHDVQTQGHQKDLWKYQPILHKAVDSIANEVKSASCLKNAPLPVEVLSDKQAEALLEANLLGSYPIQVKWHICVYL
jgi:hypothetical protein